MCGILTILDLDPTRSDVPALRRQALALARKIRHRGPDWSGIYSDERAILAHERLSIVDVEHGAQPLVDSTTGAVLAVNGEIYNHQALRSSLSQPHDFQTRSDCEVILYLYDELPTREFLNRLNGIFGFVLYDPRRHTYLIARDPIGVIPLYVGWDRQEHLYVASEMKALVGVCERIREVPPDTSTWGTKRKRASSGTTSRRGRPRAWCRTRRTTPPPCAARSKRRCIGS